MFVAMKFISLILQIFRESCPNCGKGNVFLPSTGVLKLPIMLDKCDACAYRFDREPGYFIGALYISYGLAVLEGILAFLVSVLLVPSLSSTWQILSVLAIIIICAKKNYKIARIVYIHLFPW
jgi:uncharacterized protein (DUF983 family)